MNFDASRAYDAFLLGASVTATLLAALGVVLSSRGARGSAFGVSLWVGIVAATVVATLSLSPVFIASPTYVVALALTLSLAATIGPSGSAVATLDARALLGFNALHLVGAYRFGARDVGWLPARYATVAGVLDVLIALASVIVAFRGGARARRALGVASLATLALAYLLQRAEVRPMPRFEVFYDGVLLPLFTAVGVRMVVRRQSQDDMA